MRRARKTATDKPSTLAAPLESNGKLRRAAESRAALDPKALAHDSPETLQQTLHELRVHQIELELQNEELRRAHLELDTARARYFDLYDLAPIGYCTLNQGLIVKANLTAVSMLGTCKISASSTRSFNACSCRPTARPRSCASPAATARSSGLSWSASWGTTNRVSQSSAWCSPTSRREGRPRRGNATA